MHASRDPLAQPAEAIRSLYAYVAYRIGPGPDAEDVVSETIERALRYRDSYDERKGTRNAWLVGIASRVLVDTARARSQELDPDLASEVADDFAAGAAAAVDLRRALTSLDDRSRELLALRYGAGLKAREIADLLGARTNAVEVALSRALARLRALLAEEEPELGRIVMDAPPARPRSSP